MNKLTCALLIVAFIAASVTVLPQPAAAEGNLIVVPDDFPTINLAIQNATDGDTILVREGTYNETIIIDKAITLRGEDTNNTVILGDGNQTVIQILHDNVTVTGFTITYCSTPNRPARYYQHDFPEGWMKLNGWSAIGYPLDGGYYIKVGDRRLSGIHIQNAKNCEVIGNRISDCGVGIWLWMASQNNITDNLLVNCDYALRIESSGRNNFSGNTFFGNGGGLWLPPPMWKMTGWQNDPLTVDNTFNQNNFINNSVALETQSITDTQNYWDNGIAGNYWDTYNSTDSNQDGVSDEPYQIMGEVFSGGYLKNGVWTQQVYAVDNYPLTTPFDTVSTFIVAPMIKAPQSTANAADQVLLPLAVVTALIAIAATAIYLKKSRRQNLLFQQPA